MIGELRLTDAGAVDEVGEPLHPQQVRLLPHHEAGEVVRQDLQDQHQYDQDTFIMTNISIPSPSTSRPDLMASMKLDLPEPLGPITAMNGFRGPIFL